MDNLRDFLVQKYFIRDDEKYAMEQIASNIINLLNADKNNYFDVTGFARTSVLQPSCGRMRKNIFTKSLRQEFFFYS